MDDRTGWLIKLESDQVVPEGFHVVPDDLIIAAREELAGEEQAIVDPTGPGPMSQHLRDRRRMMKKRKVRWQQLRKGK